METRAQCACYARTMYLMRAVRAISLKREPAMDCNRSAGMLTVILRSRLLTFSTDTCMTTPVGTWKLEFIYLGQGCVYSSASFYPTDSHGMTSNTEDGSAYQYWQRMWAKMLNLVIQVSVG